jgi:DNA replication protein DnaC
MKKIDRIDELVDELNELKLPNMASSLDTLYHSGSFDALDVVSLLEQVIGPEYQSKTSQRFQNRLKRAHLSGGPQSLDQCKDSTDRIYLPSGINSTLSSLDFVKEGLDVCILGPSDSGKSYLAKALGIQACLSYRAMYHHCEEFLETMVALKQSDYKKYQKKVRFYLNLDLLILDDFLLHTITDEREIKVLFEVMEKRSELSRSTIVCSQREPNSWASMILNDEVSANAILKRATKHYTVVIQPRI